MNTISRKLSEPRNMIVVIKNIFLFEDAHTFLFLLIQTKFFFSLETPSRTVIVEVLSGHTYFT